MVEKLENMVDAKEQAMIRQQSTYTSTLTFSTKNLPKTSMSTELSNNVTSIPSVTASPSISTYDHDIPTNININGNIAYENQVFQLK